MKKQLRSFLFFMSCIAIAVSVLQHLNNELPEFAKRAEQIEAQLNTESLIPTSFPAVLGEQTVELSVVKKVIDGDTIELENGQKLRYIGIDTPESKKPNTPIQCFSNEAAQRNKELVEGKQVRLLKDVSNEDMYGRLLRYVYVDDQLINEVLVKEGYAFSRTYPPDVAKQVQLGLSELEARESKRGLWGECSVKPKGKKGEYVIQ